MRTEKEKMLAEELYNAGDLELKAMRQKARQLTRLFNNTTEEQLDYRTQLLKQLFGKTGDHLFIEPPFRCDYGCHISVGENFYANFECVILDVAKVEIGDNVMFGPRVGIYTAGHPIDPEVRIRGLEFGTSIYIGNNVWIGANVTLNPGVKIGNNVIIGSGSVVTKDIPNNTIAAGNPCRFIREITAADKEYWLHQEQYYYQEIK